MRKKGDSVAAMGDYSLLGDLVFAKPWEDHKYNVVTRLSVLPDQLTNTHVVDMDESARTDGQLPDRLRISLYIIVYTIQVNLWTIGTNLSSNKLLCCC